LEGLKVDYAQQKKSLPLCITVPYYNKTEYLSALAYYTHHDIFAPNLYLHDLLGESDALSFVLSVGRFAFCFFMFVTLTSSTVAKDFFSRFLCNVFLIL